LEDLPDWLPAWCLDHLGGEPVGVLFRLQQVSPSPNGSRSGRARPP